MEEITQGVNGLAVVVGGVLAYLVGWFWYGPKMFGDKWMAGVKATYNEGDPMPMLAMGIQAVGTLLLAWVIGVFAAANALATTLLVALMVVAILASNGLYAQKSHAAILIEAGYFLVMVIIMIACQAIL